MFIEDANNDFNFFSLEMFALYLKLLLLERMLSVS